MNLKYIIIINNYKVHRIGLNDDNEIMIHLLAKQIIKASKNTILENIINPRIWLVTGSGGIAMAISKAFPNAKLFILMTGGGKYKKKVFDWAKNEKNVSILKDEIFTNENLQNKNVFYSSVKNYDDLILPYVKKYALKDDFIWNIASDDFI